MIRDPAATSSSRNAKRANTELAAKQIIVTVVSRTVRREWQAKRPSTSIFDFRSTSVLSSAYSEGVVQKEPVRSLGHSNLSTTADIYTHSAIEVEREAAVAVEQAVFGGYVPSCS